MERLFSSIVALTFITLLIGCTDDVKDKVEQSESVEQAIKVIAVCDTAIMNLEGTVENCNREIRDNEKSIRQSVKELHEIQNKIRQARNLSQIPNIYSMVGLTELAIYIGKIKMDSLNAVITSLQDNIEYDKAAIEDSKQAIVKLKTFVNYDELVKYEKDNHFDFCTAGYYENLPKPMIKEIAIIDKKDNLYTLDITSNFKPIRIVYDKDADKVIKLIQTTL